jgi:hypothetical protein
MFNSKTKQRHSSIGFLTKTQKHTQNRLKQAQKTK